MRMEPASICSALYALRGALRNRMGRHPDLQDFGLRAGRNQEDARSARPLGLRGIRRCVRSSPTVRRAGGHVRHDGPPHLALADCVRALDDGHHGSERGGVLLHPVRGAGLGVLEGPGALQEVRGCPGSAGLSDRLHVAVHLLDASGTARVLRGVEGAQAVLLHGADPGINQQRDDHKRDAHQIELHPLPVDRQAERSANATQTSYAESEVAGEYT